MSDPQAGGLGVEILHAVDGRVVLVVVILALLLAAVLVLALGRTDEDRARIRAEWQAVNGPDAPRPWGSDQGAASAPLTLGALLVGLAVIGLGFAALAAIVGPAMNAPARQAPHSVCDLADPSEC